MKKILILSMFFCACTLKTGDLPTKDAEYAKGDAIKGPIVTSRDATSYHDLDTLEEVETDISFEQGE